MKSGRPTQRELVFSVLLCVAYVVSIWFGERLREQAGSASGFWPANGFLTAALFVLPRRYALITAAVCGAGMVLFFLSVGGQPGLAIARATWNMAEALVAAQLLRPALGPRGLLRTPGGFIRLQLLAVAPACVLASLCVVIQRYMTVAPVSFLQARENFVAHLLGMATVLPAMLLMVQPSPPEMQRSRSETLLILGGVGAVVALMLHQTGPIAFVISPVLLFATFRLGPRGAAVANVLLGLLALPVVIAGTGPFTLHPDWGLDERTSIYQLTLLSSLFGVTLGAFMVAQQARLRQLLVRRATAARLARRRAIEASRVKSEFLATMSHEVRTPMNSILGFAKVLEHDQQLSPTAREHVGMIAKAGASLMALLDDVLDFSKVEAGQVDLSIESVDVVAACRDALDAIGPAAQAKGIAVSLEADPSALGLFEADILRLRQVLLNLLNNAVKFTSRGSVRLTLTRPAGADEPMMRFELADTGIGIAADVAPRLFTRFTQADSSISRQFGGTGLGLAICKGLVERMGGRIGVDSMLGAGSTFWFELPLQPAIASGPTDECAAEPPPLGARVLLVDDHPVNRQLGQALLEMLGCQVDLAASGREAVAAASQGGYDAILMDVHMPDMDGLAATRAIRALEGAPGLTPVIALSADSLPHNIAACREAGMVDHVAKPIKLDVLHDVLQRWLTEPAKAQVAAA